MATSELIFAGLFTFCLYLILRFIILECLTVILRHMPPASSFLRRQTEQGRLLRATKRCPRFQQRMGTVADFLERLTGKTFVRGITFALVTSMIILLASLPINRMNRLALDEYAFLEASANLSLTEQMASNLCLIENGLVELERQRREPAFVVPPTFKVFPVEDMEKNVRKLITVNEPNMVRALQFLDGREVIDRVEDLPETVRRDKESAKRIAAKAVNGLITPSLANLSPMSRQNTKFVETARKYCKQEKGASFQSVRSHDAYSLMVDRARERYISILHEPRVREAWFFYQTQLALNEIALSFFSALGSGFFVLMATKLSTRTCRAVWPRLWRIPNIFVLAVLNLFSIMLLLWAFGGWTAFSRVTGPTVTAIAIAYSPDGSNEEAHQAHMNYVIGRAIWLKEATCRDLGTWSPLHKACDLGELFAKPWDAVTKRFDFKALFPSDAFTKRNPDNAYSRGFAYSIALARRSPMAIGFLGFASPQKNDSAEAASLWDGLDRSPVTYFIAFPGCIVVGLAVLVYLILGLRQAVAKRVHRIIRDRPVNRDGPTDGELVV